MAERGVGNTALGAAICRLIEQYQPQETRLFDDAVVAYLVGAPLRGLLRFATMRNFVVRQTEAAGKGIYGAQVCRTRYIDDAVLAGIGQGIDQLVIPGAGLDTRPYRLPGIERVKVFEVDLAAVQSGKKKNVEKRLGRLPGNVTYLPIDFDRQTLAAVLTGSSLDPSRPAIFIWEGVTQYLTEESVRQTLAFVGKSAPGSMLVFTYVLKSIIERRSGSAEAEKIMDRVAKGQAPWIFGLEPGGMLGFLEPFHLTWIEDVGGADYQERYLQPRGRILAVFEGERIVRAGVL